MKRHGHGIPVLTLIAFAGVALGASPLAAGATPEQKLTAARQVYLELMETPDRAAPRRLLEESKCVAVIPSVIKGAFWWGGRHGNGVLSCRRGGSWSAPIFVKISGGSFGLQFGGESTDLVLFFLNERGVRSLLESKFTLGADASVAAGPAGRTAQAATDLKLKAEIYAYAKARGLYAGVAVEGSRLAPSQKMIRRYYGERLWPEEVLFEGKAPRLSPAGRAFLDVLP